MRRRLAALALPLALAACSPQQQNDAALCGLALYATPAPNGAADLLMAAQVTPACMALGMDLMQRAVLKAMVERGIR